MAFANNGNAVWSGMGRPYNLEASVNVIWDTTILPSGGFRPARAGDFAAPYAFASGTGVASSTTQRVVQASTERAITISNLTDDGTIAAGAKKLTIIFSPDYVGSIGGVVFSGVNDASVPFEAPDQDTLGSLTYTTPTGSIRVIRIG